MMPSTWSKFVQTILVYSPIPPPIDANASGRVQAMRFTRPVLETFRSGIKKSSASAPSLSARRLIFKIAAAALFAAATLPAAPAAFAWDGHGRRDRDQQWVGTWGASPQSGVEPIFGPPPAPRQFNNQTIRMIARISEGRHSVRVRLDNTFGTDSLVIGAAHVAQHGTGSGIVPGSDHPLTFGDSPTITIPPGALAISDPVHMRVADLTELALSFFIASLDIASFAISSFDIASVAIASFFIASFAISSSAKADVPANMRHAANTAVINFVILKLHNQVGTTLGTADFRQRSISQLPPNQLYPWSSQ
jgi:hypothetical protein